MKRMIKICEKCLEKNPAASDNCSKCGESLVFVNAKEELTETPTEGPDSAGTAGKFRKCRECGCKNYVEDENEYLSHCKNPNCKNPDIMKEPVEVECAGPEEPRELVLCLIYKKPVKGSGPPRESAVSGKVTDHEIRVPREGAVLGQKGDLDAEFFKRFKFVSAYHCRIYQKYGKWFVKDLGSRNGTYVHGSKGPLQPYKECVLREGKVLQLADVKLHITGRQPNAD